MSLLAEPSADGRFGDFGGRFVPETLMPACLELDAAFRSAWADPAFRGELDALLRDYAGRPSILTECHNLGRDLGVRLLLKREDLNHTGSHKINNVLGQALLAKHMGKRRLVAETGAGQHGVASATAAALLGLECKVYMGAVDVERQALNVFRMRLLGSEVEAVQSGSRTLKDAVNEAMRDWVATVEDTHYCLGSVMGPHPYPWMVREFQRVLGDEARAEHFLREVSGLAGNIKACPKADGVQDILVPGEPERRVGRGADKVPRCRHRPSRNSRNCCGRFAGNCRTGSGTQERSRCSARCSRCSRRSRRRRCGRGRRP